MCMCVCVRVWLLYPYISCSIFVCFLFLMIFLSLVSRCRFCRFPGFLCFGNTCGFYSFSFLFVSFCCMHLHFIFLNVVG